MNIFNVTPTRGYVAPYYGPTRFSFATVVESWTVEQVARWLQGTDDSVVPFIGCILKRGVDGRSLSVLDEGSLCEAGVSKLGVRTLILQAVQLLLRFCYAIDTENLQSLSMNVCVSARDLINEASRIESLQETVSLDATRLMVTLSALYAAVSRLVDELKNLMNWLDRSPFDRRKEYIELRVELMGLALALTSTVNAPNKKLLSSCSTLIEIANELNAKCSNVVRCWNDALILHTANIERAVMRRPNSQCEWGFDLQSTYLGVHMISKVKLQSPADTSGKIDAGDELLQVNGETVIGWDLGKVVEKIHHPPQTGRALQGAQSEELVLLVKKRPRETMPAHMFFLARGKRGSKMPPPEVDATVNGTNSETTNHTHENKAAVYPKPRMRHRSMSMNARRKMRVQPLLSFLSKEILPEAETGSACQQERSFEQSFVESSYGNDEQSSVDAIPRRASICLGTPPSSRRPFSSAPVSSPKSAQSTSSIYSSYDDLSIDIAQCATIAHDHRRHHSALDEVCDINSMETMVVRRRRTMRQQPVGYVRSFIDNRLVNEPDPKAVPPLIPIQHSRRRTESCSTVIVSEPSEYAVVELVKADELESLGLPPTDDDWNSKLDLSLDSTLPGVDVSPEVSDPSERTYRRVRHGISFRVRSIFSASFKSKSNAQPIAESEESSSLGWESDTADETSASLNRLRFSSQSTDLSAVHGSDETLSPKMSQVTCADFNELRKVACQALTNKQCEGWIRRRRLDSETRWGGKWTKCWMVLKSSLLYLYASSLSEEADKVIPIARFFVSDAPELKTSKKFVFRLFRSSTILYFSTYTMEDMKLWMNKLGLATIDYEHPEGEAVQMIGGSAEERSKSVSEMAQMSPAYTSHVHHTLPRAKVFNPMAARVAQVARQSSLSSIVSSSHPTLPHALIAKSPIFRRHFGNFNKS